MKYRLCTLTAAAVLVSGSAFAADLTQIPAPPPPPPVFTWAGFYIGGHVGYSGGQEHDNLSTFVDPNAPYPQPTSDKYDVSGILGGVHAGFNLQSGNFVYGIEGDFDGADINGSHAFGGEYVSPPSSSNDYDDYLSGSLHLQLDWQASVRARFGIAMDRWLVYATGGVAFGDTKLTASGSYLTYDELNSGNFSMSARNVLTGWTAGLGAEYALTDHWIGRLEVRYTDLGSGTFNFNYYGDTIPLKARISETTGLVGLSYKF